MHSSYIKEEILFTAFSRLVCGKPNHPTNG